MKRRTILITKHGDTPWDSDIQHATIWIHQKIDGSYVCLKHKYLDPTSIPSVSLEELIIALSCIQL